MLEVARALLHMPTLPKVPLIFLWTGGEEPFSPVSWMLLKIIFNFLILSQCILNEPFTVNDPLQILCTEHASPSISN